MATNTKTTVQERVPYRSGNMTLDVAVAAYQDAVENAQNLYHDQVQGNPSPATLKTALATLQASLDSARSVYTAALKAAGGA